MTKDEATQKDAVFDASIEFIKTLTGMEPPPIEIAPPEVLKPFREFTEKVCSIFHNSPPQRKPLTDEQIGDEFVRFQVGGMFTPFLYAVRAIEAAHGIKGEA